MPGSRLGPLAVESKLGDHPSQSTVWRAVHVQLHRAVAVKVFTVPFGGTQEARSDFAAEWERLKKIKHPAIARCYGGGFEEADAYLAYELIEGETVSSLLGRRGRLPWESVLELAEPITDALEHLHGRGIVCGRLHPDHVLVAGLHPKLIGVRDGVPSPPFCTTRRLTEPQLAMRAPEFVGDPGSATQRSDLYALGALLYLMLTGQLPTSARGTNETASQLGNQHLLSAASIALETPVWLDRLVMQLLAGDPKKRPHGAGAVKLALAEIRKQETRRGGVAEHASSGFSPLTVTDQRQKDEARRLLGRELVDLEDEQPTGGAAWYESAPFLGILLLLLLAGIGYVAWPLNEDAMRERAETLLSRETRSSLTQAKISYLEPMLKKFPSGEHSEWAAEQIERVEMIEAEHALSVKIKRNLPLRNEAERLFAEAQRYERFGDTATALDQYRGMVTLLGDDDAYRPFVNLARRQIAIIQREGGGVDEAARIIQEKLAEADRQLRSGNVVAARTIWYSVVELYGNNANVEPLVSRAQTRLSQLSQAPDRPSSSSSEGDSGADL